MSSFNKVILVGHLGRDPEIRQTQDGKKIANLSVATSESWRDRNSGERVEKTEWHKVSVLNEHLADIAEKYLKKGSKVMVEGTLQTRKWTDNQGQDRYSTEVVLGVYGAKLLSMDTRDRQDDVGSSTRGHSAPAARRQAPAGQRQSAPPAGGGDLDDEIPF